MLFRRKKPDLKAILAELPPLPLPGPAVSPCIVDENTPLLQLSQSPLDDLCLSDFYEGVAVWGASGSGKTSGSGKAIAHAFLRAGFGGIVLCAKEDEAPDWIDYARQTGRLDDVIRFSPNPEHGEHGFNFLEYEMHRSPDASDIAVGNAVNMLLNVLDVASRGSSLSTPAASDAFWTKSARQILGYAVDLLYATTGRVRIAEVLQLIETAPRSREQIKDETWRKSSFFAQVFHTFFSTGGGEKGMDAADAARLRQYWTHNYPNMPEKTRGNIIATISSDLDPLLRGRMRRLFSGKTTILPEDTHDGKIILLDFPVREWGDAGVLAQMIFKYVWQRATERRSITPHTRPVFLFADEASNFISAYDEEFQSTARSSRACTVLMAQNLPQFYSRIGGSVPEHTVNALLGNLRTVIFHANRDATTNQVASDAIGRETFWRQTFGENSGWSSGSSESRSKGTNSGWSGSSNYGGGEMHYTSSTSFGENEGRSTSITSGHSGGQSRSRSEQRDVAVEPSYFARNLRTGGWRNGYVVTGILMQTGRIFTETDRHWMKIGFQQR